MLNLSSTQWGTICGIGGVIISLVSLYISFRTHRTDLFSQKFQNAQTLINSFYSSLGEDDITKFRDIIMLRGESAGGDNNGHYIGDDGQLHDFSMYFAEGAPDGGALGRIIDNLERVCFFIDNESVDAKFLYSELGQFMSISCEILQGMRDMSGKLKNNNGYCCNSILVHCFRKLQLKYPKVPVKTIGYIEE